MCDSGGLTKGYRDNFDRRIMCEYFAMVCFNTLSISYSTRPATFVLRLVADHQYTDARRHRVHVADPIQRRELLRVQVALQRNSPLKRSIFADAAVRSAFNFTIFRAIVLFSYCISGLPYSKAYHN